jgi:hypothetical protein
MHYGGLKLADVICRTQFVRHTDEKVEIPNAMEVEFPT